MKKLLIALLALCSCAAVFAGCTPKQPEHVHSFTQTAAVAPTCTQAGNIAYWHCEGCGKYFSDGEGKTEIAQSGTALPATGHTPVTDAAVAATCTTTGLTEGSHCSVCSAVLVKQQTVDKTAHTAGEWITDKAATCTEKGERHKICTVCNTELEREQTEATGHTPVTDAAVAATCTATGLTEGSHCSVCSAVLVEQQTVEKTAHTAGEWITDKAATCTEKGERHKICTVCKAEQEREQTEATGHKYENGACTACGKIQPTEEELKLLNDLSADGYVKGKIGDFSQYVGTSAYRVVTTADELIAALVAAKYHYTNVWDDATSTYTQVPAEGYTEENFKGNVHVIEIANDLNLGYYKLSDAAKKSGVVSDFASKANSLSPWLSMSDMLLENGISQIKIENTSDLLIYSMNGAKITHAGFKLTSDNNVVFRNLVFDEMWQWEDAPVSSSSKIGDYDWFGWAYFKISFCGYIWIDHCTFGKSYDGQIDYSNPDYTSDAGVAFRAPYGADGGNGLHISWCNFNAGSDEKDGYLYKMMDGIEKHYRSGGTNYLYYKKLRDSGVTFNQILYGLAIPQKKGFLCGDSGNGTTDYIYNLKLQVSLANCNFKNLEDRIPKLRGGNAYMYNCIVDSSQYYSYRTELKAKNAAALVSSVNSGWKCALTSQGIVCGNGGSIMAENCIFKGIQSLLKNNDSNDNYDASGGYKLVNCSYQKGKEDSTYVGSSDDAGNKFPAPSGELSTDKFSWHTPDKSAPFTINAAPLNGLTARLNNVQSGSGALAQFANDFLVTDYRE